MIDFLSLLLSYGLPGLFTILFLSASITPFPSDPAIIIALNYYDVTTVFVVSLLGSIIGGLTSYYIGLKGIHNFLVKRSPKEEKKAQKFVEKWGAYILIVAPWIPFIGDPMLIVAGSLEMNFRKFIIFSSIGKTVRVLGTIFAGQTILKILSFLWI